jgi:hypothetical protein
MAMAMTREQMDEFDRQVMGIMPPARPIANTPMPEDPMLRPEGTAGGPVRSYSLDDIRRFLGLGGRPAMSPAEAADAAQMYERLPNRALPPTPPGGYDAPSPSIPYMPSTDPRGAAAPIPPPPRPAAPARPRIPMPPPAAPTSGAELESMATGLPIPPGGGQIAPIPMAPQVMPGEASTVPLRLNPQQLARAIQRYGRMELDPNSFAGRFARTQR